MQPSKQVGKREFIQHTSRYLQWIDDEHSSLIITHRHKPDLIITKICTKKLSDLTGSVTMTIFDDINDQILPGYDVW